MTTWPPTAAFDIVEAARDQVHAVDGADALVGGGAAFYLDTKTASQRDNKVVIPLVLLVVLVILVLLLRALTAPLILIGTVILSFGAALGHVVAALRATSSTSPGPIPGSRCSRSCSWSRWASTTTSS